ncbi:unnamed protein product [Oppiella nova]|uniref:Uncharacterized protein n=1 Tax=Oppiella nova TaxID=334625 RepID=A0A7R9QEW2_9ACAR|nr:unnamed protein product [Oppiella nova]CAG2164428.1 unnamed protein product [Oppiella nova]
MVTRPEIYADTIEDLLDDRYEVYTDDFKQVEWRQPVFYEGFGNNSFRDNFVKLVTTRLRTWDMKQLMDVFSEVSESPQKLRTFFSNKVLILDQMSMDVIEPYIPRFMAIHVGQQYLSVPITPLCVGPTFEFINQSNVIDQTIHDFYANITDGYNDIYLNDTQSLFVFIIYSLAEVTNRHYYEIDEKSEV